MSQEHDFCAKGVQPTVTINRNGDVVEVYQSDENDDLYYRVGKIDILNKQIIWGTLKVFSQGVTPSVSTTIHGMTIVVFKSSSCNKLYYQVGQISDLEIKWGVCHKYQDGLNPKITLCKDRRVLLTHETTEQSGTCHLSGYLNEKNIILICTTDFDCESKPKLDLPSEDHNEICIYESYLQLVPNSTFSNFGNTVEQIM